MPISSGGPYPVKATGKEAVEIAEPASRGTKAVATEPVYDRDRSIIYQSIYKACIASGHLGGCQPIRSREEFYAAVDHAADYFVGRILEKSRVG